LFPSGLDDDFVSGENIEPIGPELKKMVCSLLFIDLFLISCVYLFVPSGGWYQDQKLVEAIPVWR
jgi:hypothetical protein